MDIQRSIEDQDFDPEEQRQAIDWLERILDGRLIVRVPEKAFGCRLGVDCDRPGVEEAIKKLRGKILRPPRIS